MCVCVRERQRETERDRQREREREREKQEENEKAQESSGKHQAASIKRVLTEIPVQPSKAERTKEGTTPSTSECFGCGRCSAIVIVVFLC